MLIAAWIREYRNSETIVKLDDIVTPGIRRTRSVPQGDPFCDMCQPTKWVARGGSSCLGLLLFADNCRIIAMSPRELQTMARAWNFYKSTG